MTYNIDLTKARANDRVWPLRDILKKLVRATDHLLRDHDCDIHGHEEFASARDAALVILDHNNAPPITVTLPEREVKMIKSPGRCSGCGATYDFTTAVGHGMIQNVCLYCSGEIFHYCNHKCSPVPHP